jgi:hypothetical protein
MTDNLKGIELARHKAQLAKEANSHAHVAIDKALARYEKAYAIQLQMKEQIAEVYRLHSADTPESKEATKPLNAKLARQQNAMQKALLEIRIYQAMGN